MIKSRWWGACCIAGDFLYAFCGYEAGYSPNDTIERLNAQQSIEGRECNWERFDRTPNDLRPLWGKKNCLGVAISPSEILIMGGHGNEGIVAILNTDDRRAYEHKRALHMEGFPHHHFDFACHGNQCRLGHDNETIFALISTDLPSYHLISYKLNDDFVTKILDTD